MARMSFQSRPSGAGSRETAQPSPCARVARACAASRPALSPSAAMVSRPGCWGRCNPRMHDVDSAAQIVTGARRNPLARLRAVLMPSATTSGLGPSASIREWGWTTPGLVDEDGGIISGHGRVMAAQKLGIVDVPCMVVTGPCIFTARQPAGRRQAAWAEGQRGLGRPRHGFGRRGWCGWGNTGGPSLASFLGQAKALPSLSRLRKVAQGANLRTLS
jgi:hypothetical protein